MADGAVPLDANAVLISHGVTGLRSAIDQSRVVSRQSVARLPTPYRWRDPSTLPSREWLYGRYLCRGVVSITVAPGGTGKSALALCEAVALATGKSLIGSEVNSPLRVWYWNLEDSDEELQRRIQAICVQHGVSEADISDRLFVDSGLTDPMLLGSLKAGGFDLNNNAFEMLSTAIREQRIDVLIIDPFVSAHQLNENDNMQMDAVVKRLAALAADTNAAVSVVHHTRKPSGDNQTRTDSARGAKSISDAARVVRVLNPMTGQQAKDFGLATHHGYFNARIDKQNFSASGSEGQWFEIRGVALGNGDDVGVVSEWHPPSSKIDLTPEQVEAIQKRCDAEQPAFDSQAYDWAGKIIAEVIGLNASGHGDKRKAKTMLKQMLESGSLKKERARKKGKSEDRPIVRSGSKSS